MPSFAIVVLTGPRYGMLTEHDRDLIWRRWGVPVYEFLTNHAGEVIARECDAHDGLHVCDGASWKGSLQVRECGCGVTGAMIPTGAPADEVAA